jgi:predicted nucleotidyltransferase
VRKHSGKKEASIMHLLSDHPLDQDTVRTVRFFLQRVSASFPVKGAIIFGSRARGAFHADSDADVAVLLSGQPRPFVSTKLAMSDMAYDVLLETGIRVQPLPIWEEEWAHPETYPNPRLLHNIEREGVRL